MKSSSEKNKPIVVLCTLVLIAIMALAPHAFALQGQSASGKGTQPYLGPQVIKGANQIAKQANEGGIPLGPPYGTPNTPGYVSPTGIYGLSAGLAGFAAIAILCFLVWNARKQKMQKRMLI